MPVKVSVQTLVERAVARTVALSPADARQKLDAPGVLAVDLRDVRERKREGHIPNSLHVPRGMLEFWIDPDSPYHKPELAAAESLVLYCNKGWRSALATATLQDMGLDNVVHIDGGFERWSNEGQAVTHD